MTNHPNRGRGKSANPSPQEIKALRQSLGLTADQAAKLVHTVSRVWYQWESDTPGPLSRRMHPATFELFELKSVIPLDLLALAKKPEFWRLVKKLEPAFKGAIDDG